MIKVSDYIANFLVEHNINVCFTVTGGGAMHLNDSFGHHSNMKCVYNHHEQASAIAAEGYARISGKPAIVCVTSGPGATNALTGVLGAWLDSVPMVIISGQMSLNTTMQSTPIPLRQLGFQEFNIIDSVKFMTKYAETITNPKYIAYHLEKAVTLSQTGRKGPVWLDVPLDIQSSIINPDELIHYTFKSDDVYDIPNLKSIHHIFEKINKAKRPVILAGYGIRMDNCYNDFIKTISILKIPVVTEWNSNDLISNYDNYYAGRPGTIGDRGGNFVLQNADLILAIGCQFSIRQISYAWDNFGKNAYKIAVDVDRNELIKPTIKIDYPICMQINKFLKLINESKKKSLHNSKTDWYNWCKKINKKYPVVTHKHLSKKSPISVYVFIKELSIHTNSNDTIVLANGAACVSGLQSFVIKKNQRIFTNAGASSMGYGIAAAIGVCYSPNQTGNVICIEGDGSIQMNIQELQTIIHNNLNIKIFWINNDGYHSIKQTQISMFDAKNKGYCGANKDSGISFPSAEKIAYAYGFNFRKIDNIHELKSKLLEVYNTIGPMICEIVTDPDEKFEPKLQSKLVDGGKFYTPSLEDMYPFLPEEEMNQNTFIN